MQKLAAAALLVALTLSGCGAAPSPLMARGATPAALQAQAAKGAKLDLAQLKIDLLQGLEDRSFKGKGYTWSVLPTDAEFLGDVEVTFKQSGKLLAFEVEGFQCTDNVQQSGTAKATGFMDPATGDLTKVKLILLSIDF